MREASQVLKRVERPGEARGGRDKGVLAFKACTGLASAYIAHPSPTALDGYWASIHFSLPPYPPLPKDIFL